MEPGLVMQQAAQVASDTPTINWLMVLGLGCLWLGGQIVWVAPWPRQVRRLFGQTDVPTAKAGTPAAFGLFWIDQYGWIGLSLCGLGAGLVIAGVLS